MTATTVPTPISARATEGSDGASFVTGTLAIAGRTLRAFVRTPQQIVFGTIVGAMFLLLFRYVFGGAISTPGLDYVDFIVPGFLVSGILFGGQESAVGVAADMESGLFDRLRSLPIHRTSVLAGRALADVGRLAWSTTATALIGVAIGFRPSGSVAELVLAAVLVLTYGLAFSWVFTTMGPPRSRPAPSGPAAAAQSQGVTSADSFSVSAIWSIGPKVTRWTPSARRSSSEPADEPLTGWAMALTGPDSSARRVRRASASGTFTG